MKIGPENGNESTRILRGELDLTPCGRGAGASGMGSGGSTEEQRYTHLIRVDSAYCSIALEYVSTADFMSPDEQ